MEFNIYDMLVFEDESGSIYQDCVCEIENNPVYVACTEDEEDEYFHTVICNQFEIHLDSEYDIFKIERNNEGTFNKHEYNLKQIWTRTDEDTYKKVWENK